MTALTGRDVSWLAPCRLPCARLSRTSKRDAKASAGRRGRELSGRAGRRCSRCQCKHWQAGKAQRDAEGVLCRPQGWLLPGGRWWVRPFPDRLPYLRSEASCGGLLISWRGRAMKPQWGGHAFPEDSLEHPLIAIREETPPWQHWDCAVATLLRGGSRRRCLGSAWYVGMQRGMPEHGAVSPEPLEEVLM